MQQAQLNFEEILSEPISIAAERSKRSLFYFIQEFWTEVSTDDPDWNWHIPYLCGRLMQLAINVSKKRPNTHDLIINIPPGTTKSITCVVMFPAWCWTRWPWMRFITSSYSGPLALEHAELSRDLVRSEKYQEYFPNIQIKRDKDTKSNFQIQEQVDGEWRRAGSRFSTSVNGTLTGYHGHILLVDDPLDPNRSVSEVELEKGNRWIDQTLSTRKIDKLVTPTILIMQRLVQNDPTGHLLKKRKGRIKHICLPGEIKNYKDKLNPLELEKYYTDGLLDQKRMPWSVLDDMMMDLGQYGYAGQVGQDPVPPGGGMFKVAHFQLISTLPRIAQTVRYWDKAGTQGGGAYTAGVKISKLVNGKFVVTDVKRGQWATDERENIIRETAESDGPSVVIYHEQEPGSGGKDSAQATVRNLSGFSNYADRPTGNKVYRADPYSVQVNNGNVLLLAGPWVDEFVEEHRFFPFSTFKDQVDAASGGFNKLARKKIAGPI